MNAPSSLAWMLSEILHGCPAFDRTVMVHFCSISSHSWFGFRQCWISIDYSSFWAFLFTRAFPTGHLGPGSVILYATLLIRCVAHGEPWPFDQTPLFHEPGGSRATA